MSDFDIQMKRFNQPREFVHVPYDPHVRGLLIHDPYAGPMMHYPYCKVCNLMITEHCGQCAMIVLNEHVQRVHPDSLQQPNFVDALFSMLPQPPGDEEEYYPKGQYL